MPKTPSERCNKQRTAVNTLAFSAQQGLLELLDRFVYFEPLAQCRCSYVTNFVATQTAKRVGSATTPSECCSKQRIGVYTLAFFAQQGLLELLGRFVHFEPPAQSRRSNVTNAVAVQAAERITNATTPSKRCRKQRTAVNTLAFSAQQGLLERLDRVVHFESLAQCCRPYVTNVVVPQSVDRPQTRKLCQNAAADSASRCIR